MAGREVRRGNEERLERSDSKSNIPPSPITNTRLLIASLRSSPNTDDVLPYFRNVQDDTTGRDSKFHGQGGEWTMSEVRYQNPLSKKFLEVAGEDLGINDDFNNWDRPQSGAGRFQVSERNGCRESGATAFLEKALKRKNLTVRTGAMIRQIDFASTSAVGVTYNIVNDDTLAPFSPSLAANGEVILTAGAIASPQILMASGVGPRDHLEDLSIPVISDLPGVGSNLQDHPAAVVSFETPKKGGEVEQRTGGAKRRPNSAYQFD